MNCHQFKRMRLHSPERFNKSGLKRRRYSNEILTSRNFGNLFKSIRISFDNDYMKRHLSSIHIQRIYRGWKTRKNLHIIKFLFYN